MSDDERKTSETDPSLGDLDVPWDDTLRQVGGSTEDANAQTGESSDRGRQSERSVFSQAAGEPEVPQSQEEEDDVELAFRLNRARVSRETSRYSNNRVNKPPRQRKGSKRRDGSSASADRSSSSSRLDSRSRSGSGRGALTAGNPPTSNPREEEKTESAGDADKMDVDSSEKD